MAFQVFANSQLDLIDKAGFVATAEDFQLSSHALGNASHPPRLVVLGTFGLLWGCHETHCDSPLPSHKRKSCHAGIITSCSAQHPGYFGLLIVDI